MEFQKILNYSFFIFFLHIDRYIKKVYKNVYIGDNDVIIIKLQIGWKTLCRGVPILKPFL